MTTRTRPTVRGPWVAALVAALALLALALYALALPRRSVDMTYFLLPWVEEIRARGFAAMSGEYANYTPPYLYLLGLAAALGPGVPGLVLVKGVSIAFTLVAALVVAAIVRDVTDDPVRAAVAGAAFPLLPTVALNAAWWGQCDIVYTTFLLLAFLASLRGRALLVVLSFALALAFKAQAIFFAPYLLFLAARREVPWRHALLVPLVFAAMMVPAWIAGRDAAALALVYASQGDTYHRLSMNAPNPWALLRHWEGLDYAAGLALGAVAALAAALAVARRGARLAGEAGRIKLVVAATSVLVLPYLLPKMHDRYFFPADVFLVLLACVVPRAWIAAASMQAASLIVYVAYLADPNGNPRGYYSAVGLLFTTLAIGALLREWRRHRTRASVAVSASSSRS